MIDGHFKTDRKKYVIVWLHRNTGRKRERRKYYEKEIFAGNTNYATGKVTNVYIYNDINIAVFIIK